MKTYHRVCLDDHVIEDGDRRLELKRGKEYLTSDDYENGTVVVFSSYWAHGIPTEWFSGAKLFTSA